MCVEQCRIIEDMWHEDIAPISGFHPEIGLLLAALDDSTRAWRQNLGEPPVEAVIWQIVPNGPSIGALILHMIDTETFWFERFIGGKTPDPEEGRLLMSEEVQQYEGIWPRAPEKPIEWYFELQARYRRRALESLKGVEPDRFFRESDDVESSARWVVSHVVQHDSYHGGQAVLVHEQWKRRQS